MAHIVADGGRRRQPGVDVGEQRGLDVVGRARGAHRHRGQLGELLVGEVVRGAHRGVLVGQPGAEQQRVVGAERDGGAGLEQLRQRHRGQVASRRRARRWRPGRPPGRRPASTSRSSRRGSSTDRTPWPSRSACSVVEARPHGVRARAARRRAGPSSSPARSAIAKAGAKSAVTPAPLVVGEPEADHAAAGVLRGQPGQGARVERVPGAVGRDHHGDARGRSPRERLAHGVEHQVGERGDPAEPRGVPARVDLDLQPAAAVARRRPRPPRAPAGVRRPRCAAPTGRRRRAAGSGTSPSRRPPTAAAASRSTSASGSRMPSRSASSSSVACRIDPVKCRCRCAFGQRRAASRPRRPARSSRRQPSSFWIRPTPSTRSSSPSA